MDDEDITPDHIKSHLQVILCMRFPAFFVLDFKKILNQCYALIYYQRLKLISDLKLNLNRGLIIILDVYCGQLLYSKFVKLVLILFFYTKKLYFHQFFSLPKTFYSMRLLQFEGLG